MFIAIVQIPMEKRPRDAAVEAAAKSAPTYTALGAKGLLRKYYLNGEAGGGGVYLWNSEAAARAWYTPEWEKRMEAAFGARPTVTYYDNHVVVDNVAGAVRVEESLSSGPRASGSLMNLSEPEARGPKEHEIRRWHAKA